MKATIAQEMAYSFESQARQFPTHGDRGISYERHLAENRWPVDCLLWRNRNGHLVGILYHYPTDSFLEKAGNVNLYVRSDSRNQGVGSRLVREAQQRWDINFEQQRYTPSGLALAQKLLKGTR